MDVTMTVLRLAALFLCALYITEAFSGSSSTCCTQLGKKVSKKVLQKVIDIKKQKKDGVCHLQAFVLYTRERTLCVSTRNKQVKKKWIEMQDKEASTRKPQRRNGPGKRKNNRAKNRRKTKKNKKKN
ncbi:C-C motif chemokine 28 isoform X2 [Hyperolius riggenbachi]|uniref:C-C motif chemokine 28 isoform X2 n=1 Tax=Hyperolius riggenbachi TaxID=752182 RepID=UPI0035A2DCB3